MKLHMEPVFEAQDSGQETSKKKKRDSAELIVVIQQMALFPQSG